MAKILQVSNLLSNSFAMGRFTQVLVQVMLFQFLGRCLAQDGATPNFSPDSNSSLSGLSNKVLFDFEFISEFD